MATTQYIGARYVPLFFTNPDDNSNNWKSGVAYDPLTVVTDLNQSYTSKIPVPASIGRPSENPTYWILTGAYSAQLEQYRQEIAAYKSEVDNYSETLQSTTALANAVNLRGRNFILIGDSYAAGVNPDAPTEGGWAKKFHDYAAGWANVYYNIEALGGMYGFASSRPYIDVIRSLESEINDPASITDIAVFGGTNDLAVTANVLSRIEEFANYCHTRYPNATVKIGCLGFSIKEMAANLAPIYSQCVKYGCEYVHDTQNLICDSTYIASDNVHLTNAGYNYYSPYIAEAIITGHTHYVQIEAVAVSLTEGITPSVGSLIVKQEVTENGYSFTLRASNSSPAVLNLTNILTPNSFHKIGFAPLKLHTPSVMDQLVTGTLYLIKLESVGKLYPTQPLYPVGFYFNDQNQLYIFAGQTPAGIPENLTGHYPRLFIDSVGHFKSV